MRLQQVVSRLLVLFLLICLGGRAFAEVSLEEVVQAGKFVFYRDSAEKHKYYYAPDQPRLATAPDGKAEFTFIKYTRAGAEGTNPQAKGGIVHFLVTWGFDAATRSAAENALKGQDKEAQLVGPIPFKEGTFALVSASAGEGGIFTRKIVGTGKAPVLPGMKAAVSIALTPEGATLLWDSFQKLTSDVSVVFLLKFSGLTPAFSAKLKVNWDQVYTHHDVAAGISAQYTIFKAAADVRAILDEFRRNGTIQLEVTGENQNMQRLLDVAYEHILRQMFDPVMLPPDAATTPQAGAGTAGSSGGASRGRTSPRAPVPLSLADALLPFSSLKDFLSPGTRKEPPARPQIALLRLDRYDHPLVLAESGGTSGRAVNLLGAFPEPLPSLGETQNARQAFIEEAGRVFQLAQ